MCPSFHPYKTARAGAETAPQGSATEAGCAPAEHSPISVLFFGRVYCAPTINSCSDWASKCRSNSSPRDVKETELFRDGLRRDALDLGLGVMREQRLCGPGVGRGRPGSSSASVATCFRVCPVTLGRADQVSSGVAPVAPTAGSAGSRKRAARRSSLLQKPRRSA